MPTNATAFGGPLGDKQFVQESIAASRMEIDQARLLTLYAAWKMDTEGKRAARQAISAIKIVAANMVMDVLDRAIQIHGSLGMTDDTPLAIMWRFSRMLRLADGPDEVHKMVLARRELNRWAKRAEAEAEGEPRAAARRRGWSERTRIDGRRKGRTCVPPCVTVQQPSDGSAKNVRFESGQDGLFPIARRCPELTAEIIDCRPYVDGCLVSLIAHRGAKVVDDPRLTEEDQCSCSIEISAALEVYSRGCRWPRQR